MSKLSKFILDNGEEIWIETEAVNFPGTWDEEVPVSREESQVVQRFETAMAKVRPAASAVIDSLRNMVHSPDEVQVEFGIKMSAEAGAIIASSGLEANFKVALKWKQERKEQK